jgi:carboxyl-terminal processing protease
MPMRWTLPWFAGLLFLGFALASKPVSHTDPAPPALEGTDSRRFALQLQEIIVRVMQRYTRPVDAEELAAAALKGLYEAAQAPVPASLQADVNAAAKEGKLIALFIQTREALGNPEGLRGHRAIVASIQGMTKALDPFCAVLPIQEGANGRGVETVFGLGLELTDSSSLGALIVKSATLGGPAQRAGLRPGDQITRVNGKPASKPVAGRPNWLEESRVTLTFIRPGSADARTVLLRSESFHPEVVVGVSRRADNSWEYFLAPDEKIAQVRILSFDSNTSAELPHVLSELLTANMRGLILDLRWCPGGYLDASRAAAFSFLGEYNPAFFVMPTPMNWLALADVYLDNHCKNASVWYRDGQVDGVDAVPEHSFVRFPMVVLVNAETSGGAELVAAVLQDNKRAFVAGQRTRGKASVQRLFKLTGEDPSMPLTVPIPGMELKLSTGLLQRPSGKNLNRYPDSKPSDDWGVRPDRGLEFRHSAELDRRVKEWWQALNLRPGASTESLPLDDPANDPDRQAALELLLKALK